MKEVNKEVLKDCANRLLFDMKDEEYETLLEEFDVILSQLKLMDDIEGIDNISPMSFPYGDESFSILREDEEGEEILTKEEMLKNAKEVKDGQIKLPKVVG